jgi:diguanylate cyclase (GGDEF)-like protein
MWARINSAGEWQGEIWNRKKTGEVFPQWLTITAVKGEDGSVTHYVATLTDITARKAAEAEMQLLAFYDPLTKLPNRRLLQDRLQHAMTTSARTRQYCALMFVDLDNFKSLNDTMGHDVGDLMLQIVGQRLAICVREGDTVSRVGGDEFMVMLENLHDSAQEAAVLAENIGKKILAAINQPFQLAGQECITTASIGITLFINHIFTVAEIQKQADLAMYAAKTAGRNVLRFYKQEL